jgi:methyltransferase
LGPQWNSRVVVPGVARVAAGPYRCLSHPNYVPNYVAVVAEEAALPLVHTAWITAALLRTPIKVENTALASLT